MKKILLLALTAILAVSCMEQNEDGTFHAPQSDSSYSYYTTVTIDSCEYIHAVYRLAHKGICRYCAEEALIRQAMDKAKGDRKKAAKTLGISERTLYRRMKEYNIE